MLKKYQRLNNSEFKEVFKLNSPYRVPGLLLLQPESPLLFPKYAVAVSKKLYPRRVDRNRLRRVIDQAIRQLINGQNKLRSGIVVVSKADEKLINYSTEHINLLVTKLLVVKD